METTQIYMNTIPRDLVAHFKAHCARRGRSMKLELIRLIKERIKDDPDPMPGRHERVLPERRRTVNIRDVPIKLKSEFKAWCAEDQRSMTEIIINIMENAIDA